MELLTTEQFKEALPEKARKSVNKSLVDQINGTLSNPEEYENFRDNLLSYGKVMAEGKFKIPNYICAVRYVSYKLQGRTSIDSYGLTFPGKIARFQADGVKPKDISSYVTAYNKSKLVNLIMEQSLVPSWVLNQDLYQKALNTQAELMIGAKSEKVRSDAAAHLMAALKAPETTKVELDIGVKDSQGVVDQLREATYKLVVAQKEALMAGATDAQAVAHSKVIVEGEYEEVG
jgi:hypothetical protein